MRIFDTLLSLGTLAIGAPVPGDETPKDPLPESTGSSVATDGGDSYVSATFPSSAVPSPIEAVPSAVSARQQESDYLRRYSRFVHDSAVKVFRHFIDRHDRGIIASPLGSRDIAHQVLQTVLHSTTQKDITSRLGVRDILIVTNGGANRDGWVRRLTYLAGERMEQGSSERTTWKINGKIVRLISIHVLSRMEADKREEVVKKSGFFIVDREHHIRAVEDQQGANDRTFFINFLIEAGFLKRTDKGFEVTKSRWKYLLGLSETVTAGAGMVYGGSDGTIVAETIPSLINQKIARMPKVGIVHPLEADGRTGVASIAPNGNIKSRVFATVMLLEHFRGELAGELGRRPRIIVYCGSREEALALTERLKAIPDLANDVSLVSTDTGFDTRAERKRFLKKIISIAVDVRSLADTGDHFQREPVDLAIVSSLERSGRQFALGILTSHMTMGEKPPLLIDMADLFVRYPLIPDFDPEMFIVEDGKVRAAAPLAPRVKHRTFDDPPQTINSANILTVDLTGDHSGQFLSSYLKKMMPAPNSAALALALNCSIEQVTDIWEGSFVPVSGKDIRTIGEEIGLDKNGVSTLLGKWAFDRLRAYERFFPIPKGLLRGEKEVLRAARFGLIRYYFGSLVKTHGKNSAMLDRYLKEGVWPDGDNWAAKLARDIAGLIGGPGNEQKGLDYIEARFGRIITRNYWFPTRTTDFRDIDPEKIRTWERASEHLAGFDPSMVAVSFRTEGEKVLALRPIAPNEEVTGEHYGKIVFRKMPDGSYLLISVVRPGGILENIKAAPKFGSEIKSRSDAWIGAKKMMPVEDLKDLGIDDLAGEFKRLSREHGGAIKEMVMQYTISDGVLASISFVTPEEATADPLFHGKIRIFEVERGEKYRLKVDSVARADAVVGALRGSKAAKAGLKIQSDGWIGVRALRFPDLKEIERMNIEEWFASVSKASGKPVRSVDLSFFAAGGSGQMISFEVAGAADWPAETERSYLRIERSSDGGFEITRVLHKGALRFLEEVRGSKIFGKDLRFRSIGWLTDEFSLKVDEMRDLRRADLKKWFDQIETGTGERPKRIFVQYQHNKGKLLSIQPLLALVNDTAPYGGFAVEEQSAGEFYEIVSVKGAKKREIAGFVREGATPESGITIGTDGLLGARIMMLEDIRALRGANINRWFDRASERLGSVQDEITIEFVGGAAERLDSFRIITPDEENEALDRGRVRIRRCGAENFEVSARINRGTVGFINALRVSPAVSGKTPVLAVDPVFSEHPKYKMVTLKDRRTVRRPPRGRSSAVKRRGGGGAGLAAPLGRGPGVRRTRRVPVRSGISAEPMLDIPSHIMKGSLNMAVGSIPFAIGEFGSKLIMGRELPTPAEFASNYIPLSTGGSAGRMMVDGIENVYAGRPFLTAEPGLVLPSKGIAGAFAKRTVPLFFAISLAELAQTGKIAWSEMPHSIARIMMASLTTHGIGRLVTYPQLVKKIASAMKILKIASVAGSLETVGVTLIGAAIASVVEFTLIEVFAELEQKFYDYTNEERLKKAYAGALAKNNSLIDARQNGADPMIEELESAQEELFFAQYMYESYLGSKVERLKSEQLMKHRELEREEAMTLADPIETRGSIASVRERYKGLRKKVRDEYHEKIYEIVGDGEKYALLPETNPSPALNLWERFKRSTSPVPPEFRDVISNEESSKRQIRELVAGKLDDFRSQADEYASRINSYWSGDMLAAAIVGE